MYPIRLCVAKHNIVIDVNGNPMYIMMNQLSSQLNCANAQ